MTNAKQNASVAVCVILIMILWILPTGYEKAGAAYRDGGERAAAKVISVDNSMIMDTGLIRSGDQKCQVILLSGKHKGEVYSAGNMLTGSF